MHHDRMFHVLVLGGMALVGCGARTNLEATGSDDPVRTDRTDAAVDAGGDAEEDADAGFFPCEFAAPYDAGGFPLELPGYVLDASPSEPPDGGDASPDANHSFPAEAP